VLRIASEKEARKSAAANTEFMASAVGDTEKIDRIRVRFKTGNYGEVVQIASTIRYMENVSPTIQKMIETAKKRSTDRGAVGSD
jgi:hypothetical protein